MVASLCKLVKELAHALFFDVCLHGSQSKHVLFVEVKVGMSLVERIDIANIHVPVVGCLSIVDAVELKIHVDEVDWDRVVSVPEINHLSALDNIKVIEGSKDVGHSASVADQELFKRLHPNLIVVTGHLQVRHKAVRKLCGFFY